MSKFVLTSDVSNDAWLAQKQGRAIHPSRLAMTGRQHCRQIWVSCLRAWFDVIFIVQLVTAFGG